MVQGTISKTRMSSQIKELLNFKKRDFKKSLCCWLPKIKILLCKIFCVLDIFVEFLSIRLKFEFLLIHLKAWFLGNIEILWVLIFKSSYTGRVLTSELNVFFLQNFLTIDNFKWPFKFAKWLTKSYCIKIILDLILIFVTLICSKQS